MVIEKRKPAAGTTGPLIDIEKLPGKFDAHDDIRAVRERQACRIRTRHPGLSWPVARLLAELCFGRAA